MSPHRTDNGILPPDHRADEVARAPTPSFATTAEQVRDILSAANQRADETRRHVEDWAITRVRDVEEQALRYLDQAKASADALVSERLDPIVELTAVVEQRSERVISLLEETEQIKAELRDLLAALRDALSRSPAVLADRAEPASPPPAATSDEPAEPGEDRGVLLLSLQMAIQGASRSEVERKLTDEFDVQHPQAILDEVFGADTPPSHRIAWNVATAGHEVG